MEVLDSMIGAVRRCCAVLPDKRRGTNGHDTMAASAWLPSEPVVPGLPAPAGALSAALFTPAARGAAAVSALVGVAEIPQRDSGIRMRWERRPKAPSRLHRWCYTHPGLQEPINARRPNLPSRPTRRTHGSSAGA